MKHALWMEQHGGEIFPFEAFQRQHFPAGTAVVEIGVRHGGTSELWHNTLDAPIVIGVDRVGADSYQEPVFTERAEQMERELPRFKFVRGDSHDPNTQNVVSYELGVHGVGFLFIDGDHSYEGVKQDYAMYSPFVVPGGLIAFHDIVDGPRTGGGVHRFWHELVGRKTEFLVSPPSDWGGIGVLQV